MAEMRSKREQWDTETKYALDDACQTLIELARQNPTGECWAMIRAADAATGETFRIAVLKEADNG